MKGTPDYLPGVVRENGYREVEFEQVCELFQRKLVYSFSFRLLMPGPKAGRRRPWELVRRRRWMIVFNPGLSKKADGFEVRRLLLMCPGGFWRYSFTEFPEAFDVLEAIGFGPFSAECVAAAEPMAIEVLEAAVERRARLRAAGLPSSMVDDEDNDELLEAEPLKKFDYRAGCTYVGKLVKELPGQASDYDESWPVCVWSPEISAYHVGGRLC